MPAAKPNNDRRKSDLAMIHIAAKRLFGDDRAAYEDWLERLTGRRSAGDLNPDERIRLVGQLRRDGLIPERARGGIGQTASGAERPTPAQWARIGGLAREIGWEKGLEDDRLQRFVERTAKVSSSRFLSREGASKVILGLESWRQQRGRSAAGGGHAVP